MKMTPEETASIVARYLALAQLYGEAIPSSGLTEDEKTAASKVAARRLTEEIGNADVFFLLHPVTWENVKAVYDKVNVVLSTKPNDYAEYVTLPSSAQGFKRLNRCFCSIYKLVQAAFIGSTFISVKVLPVLHAGFRNENGLDILDMAHSEMFVIALSMLSNVTEPAVHRMMHIDTHHAKTAKTICPRSH